MTLIQLPVIKKADYARVSKSPPNTTRRRNNATKRSIFAIARQRTFLIAAFGGFVSWSAMAIPMSATPLAMTGAGHSYAESTTAIEYHLLGMFAPSFFTGNLCDWFGNRLVLLIGLLMQLAGILLFQRGLKISHFNTGLIIIGIGWNLGYVGASALLTQSHRRKEKLKAHSLFEAIVMSGICISFFSSAFIEQHFGWTVLTGKIISTYLLVSVLIVSVDTALAFFKHQEPQESSNMDDREITIGF